MDRITEKKLKEWLETDSLYSTGLFELNIYSGYYHIQSKENGNNLIVEETPRKCWECWNYFKSGYRFGKHGILC